MVGGMKGRGGWREKCGGRWERDGRGREGGGGRWKEKRGEAMGVGGREEGKREAMGGGRTGSELPPKPSCSPIHLGVR